jgi:IMP dehydrogenase
MSQEWWELSSAELIEMEHQVDDYLTDRGLPRDIDVTFEDVRIMFSRISRINFRSDVRDFRARVCRDTWINIPLIATNMRDVTGMETCIAMAEEGGMGIIPQFLSLEKRLEIIGKVKRAHSGVLNHPWCVKPSELLGNARRLMAEKKVTSLLVTEDGADRGKLVGLMSRRDWMAKIDNPDLPVSEVMNLKVITADPKIAPNDAEKIMRRHKIEKLPLVNENGCLRGLIVMKEIEKRKLFPRAARDSKGRLLVGAAVGMNEYNPDPEKEIYRPEIAARLLEAEADIIMPDAPNANARFMKIVRHIRENFPEAPLLAGSVDHPYHTKALIKAGADAVKVGIGCGSACETRVEVGVGTGQVTAIAWCKAVAGDIPIVSDGGISDRFGRDLQIAIVAGANCVLSGSLFAGTQEAPAPSLIHKGRKVKPYRGSASFESQLERVEEGNLDRGRAPEGEMRLVPFKGSVKEVIEQRLGWLSSAMAFCDAFNLEELRANAVLRRQTRACYDEGA